MKTIKKILIKVGGSVLANAKNMKNICHDIKELRDANIDVIVVHGGGSFITSCLEKMSMKSTFIDGYRVSPIQHISTIQMAMYSVNKELSKTFSSINVNAIGVSGDDSNLLCCDFLDKKKYGHVGSIISVNTEIIYKLLEQQIMPIVATIGITGDYESVNINADDIAMKLAIGCNVDEVVFITDQEGVYDENNKILANLSMDEIKSLIDTKVVIDGMKIKLENIMKLLKKTKKPITILSGKEQGLLTKKFLLGQNFGTTCVYQGGISNEL